jgi:hypothetical protein
MSYADNRKHANRHLARQLLAAPLRDSAAVFAGHLFPVAPKAVAMVFVTSR